MRVETRFRRRIEDRFVAEKLPDGSLAVFDAQTEAVHALNESATLVLEACEGAATVPDVVALLESCTGGPVTEATALEILQRLESVELVVREQTSSRRSLLRTAAMGSAALALPALLTLTASEQRLHAQVAGSPTTTAAPTTTSTSTTTIAPTTTSTTPLAPTTTSTTTLAPTTTSTTSTTSTTTSTTTTTTSTTSTTTTMAPTTTTTTTTTTGAP